MGLATQAIHRGDCLELLAELPAGSVDLVFADPPFNIGYEYDVYDDRQTHQDYIDWSRKWIAAVSAALKPDGTFWLAIGDDYAAELKLIAQEIGLTTRSWVIWYYTFGVNCTRKFSRSHTHLFHFVKDAEQFTFNADDPAVRVPSARQLVYGDKRANARGRLPDDTWVLRPQDAPESFGADEDTWYFARVAGTFKERAGFHGCQMPEQLLARIIRTSSNPGDLVLDPFAGSGSTLVVAKKLERDWIGCELSPEYAEQATARLAEVDPGDPLDGPADPQRSAPSTREGVRLSKDGLRVRPAADKAPRSAQGKGPAGGELPQQADAEEAPRPSRRRAARRRSAPRTSADADAAPGAGKTSGGNGSSDAECSSATERSSAAEREQTSQGIVEAYLAAHGGHSTDRVLADPRLNRAFLAGCRDRKLAGKPADWNRQLMRLRKARRLPRLADRPPRTLTAREMDAFSFASEIALAELLAAHDTTVDELLCTPALARRFDKLAASYAPGHPPLAYRWAALSWRKRTSAVRRKWETSDQELSRDDLPRAVSLARLGSRFDGVAGAYLLRSRQRAVYAGETFDLGSRLRLHAELGQSPPWSETDLTSAIVVAEPPDGRVAQLQLVEWFAPQLNGAPQPATA